MIIPDSTVSCLFMVTNLRMVIPCDKAWNKVFIQWTKYDIREVRIGRLI